MRADRRRSRRRPRGTRSAIDAGGGASETCPPATETRSLDDATASTTAERLERELRLYRDLVATSGEGIYRLDFDPPVPVSLPVDSQVRAMLAAGRVAAANDAQARMYGYRKGEELVGMSIRETLVVDDPTTWASLVSFVEGGHRYTDEESLERDRDGRERRFLNSAVGVVEDGHLVAAWGSQRDVTAERDAVARLAESERKFALAFHSNPGAMAISRIADSVFLDVNDSFAALVDLPREELVGRAAIDLGLWQDAEERRRVVVPILERGSVHRVQVKVRGASGAPRLALVSGMAIEVERERCMLVLVEDVTELEHAQRALAESEARLRAAVDGSLDAFGLLEAVRGQGGECEDFVVTELNQAACGFLGASREQILGRRVSEVIATERLPPLLDRYRRVYEYRRSLEEEIEIRPARGAARWIHHQAVALPDGVAVWARDLTERRRAEDQRRRDEAEDQRTQKLESLGLLAAGVAHDFNNLLTAILGYADVAARRLSQDSPAAAPVREIGAAAQRAADLTEKMLAFAGGGALRFDWIPLNEIVREMVELVRPSLPPGREFRFALAHPAPGVEADATQVRQVALNLLLNASEAMGEAGGTIEVATGEVSCDRERLDRSVLGAESPEGRYAFLAVTDEGAGLPDEIQERIFEPFFTTKFAGRGLGLAAVHGIVRAHRGAIEVASTPGRGSRFTVLLPLAQAAPRAPGEDAESG